MSKTYKNSPIVEAVLELQLKGSVSYNETSILEFHKNIESLFPDRKKAKRNEVEIKVVEEQINKKSFEFDIFLSEDKRCLVQLEEKRLSIHRLKPYISWKSFFPLIEKVLETHNKTINHIGLNRIGLRYVNLIDAKGSVSDNFNITYSLPSKLEKKISSSFGNFVLKVDGGGDSMSIRLGEAQDQTKTIKQVLDLDYFNDKGDFGDELSLNNWINQAHSFIENIFEDVVKEQVKESFNK
jgi:uncharacterized protein (TIGR04255 family)